MFIMTRWTYLSLIVLSSLVREAEIKRTFNSKASRSQPSQLSHGKHTYDIDADDYEDHPELYYRKEGLIRLSKKPVALACSSKILKSQLSQEPLCLNGGTCISVNDDGYECRCSLEYTGQFCQFLNACAASPCKNGGTCQPFDDSGVCECPMGYTGIFCEIVDMQHLARKKVPTSMPKTMSSKTLAIEAKSDGDPCLSAQRKCQNNGKCINTGDSTYECECTRDFSGGHCQYDNPCRDYPCKNGGTCVTFDDSGICYCLSGFFGTYCQKSQKHSLVVGEATRRPTISRVWRSRRKPKDACDSLEPKCYNGGTCVAYGKKSFQCLCHPVFAGDLCQFTNACEKNPCRNGGVCESYEDSGVCKCPYGFKGTYCESIDDTPETYLSRIRKGRRFPTQFSRSGNPTRLPLDHCDNGEEDDKKPTCFNGGRCSILDEHSYECECSFGFTGKFCQFLDVCGSSPCLNGATCESYEDSGVCRCRKGFTGIFCEDEVEIPNTKKLLEIASTRKPSKVARTLRHLKIAFTERPVEIATTIRPLETATMPPI